MTEDDEEEEELSEEYYLDPQGELAPYETPSEVSAYKQRFKAKIAEPLLAAAKAQIQQVEALQRIQNVSERLKKDERWTKAMEIFDEADIANARAKGGDNQEKANFPIFIFLLAIAKDVLVDGGTGSLVSWLGSALLGIIIFLWLRKYFAFGQKGLVKWGVKRMLIAMGLEAIPIIAFLPWSIIYVILAYYKKTKAVQIMFAVLEAIKKHDLNVKKIMQNSRN